MRMRFTMTRLFVFGAIAIVLAGCGGETRTTQTKASASPARPAALPKAFIPTDDSDLATEDDIAQLDALVRDTFGERPVYVRHTPTMEWILTTKRCSGCPVYRLTHEGREHPAYRLLARSTPKQINSNSEALGDEQPLLVRRRYVYVVCAGGNDFVYVGQRLTGGHWSVLCGR